ncbi:MAG: patatin-like phospholipase family protein [Candidatus Bipolaricaulaceae bacterium]
MGVPRLGLALGGGGARGLAHAGVLLELAESGIRPTAVAGTSMGAVVGGLYAVGQDVGRLVEVIGQLDLREIFGVPESYRQMLERSVGQALLERFRRTSWWEEPSPRLARLYEFLGLFCKGRRFEGLPLPFAAVCADLDSGEEVDLRRGPLYRGLAASAAIPGVFQPVPWAGRFLIDGGVVNNLPVDVVQQLGAESVLAVDVSAPLFAAPRSMVEIVLQSYAITAKELARVKLARAADSLGDRLMVIRPQVDGIGVLEFERLPEAVEAGRAAAAAALERYG